MALAWLVNQLFSLYGWLLIIRVFMSWVRPNEYHQVVRFLYRITDPVLDPARQIIPPWRGIDFSPILVLFLLEMVRNLVVGFLLRLSW